MNAILSDICGNGFTVTFTESLAEHPAASVPVTTYVVVEAGVTESGLAELPVDQLYDVAPDARSEADAPAQMLRSLPATTTDLALTITVTVSEFEQPFAFVPVTM